MPKRILFAAGLLALVLVACNKGTVNSGQVPTPGPSPTYSANPTITQATVTAFFQGNYQPGVTVFQTTSNNGVIGTPITSLVTNGFGQAIFTKLVPGVAYCWYFNPTPTLRSTICTNEWDSGITVGS